MPLTAVRPWWRCAPSAPGPSLSGTEDAAPAALRAAADALRQRLLSLSWADVLSGLQPEPATEPPAGTTPTAGLVHAAGNARHARRRFTAALRKATEQATSKPAIGKVGPDPSIAWQVIARADARKALHNA